ncbi:MAG: hypothetical protein K0M67_01370 [Thiobacillus sp.]|uniref:hypothetical protein n=1 Tax=Hydrogenophaga aromaticivorans TaxID=2610898 RepID=UPI001C431BD2|nr:hypothetical protein [Hydrogenophaga aromaticivorans]MBW8466885.1 hypothetical protein [Thiobacillus sp.]
MLMVSKMTDPAGGVARETAWAHSASNCVDQDQIQVSQDGATVWVHSTTDGSTVGRFSKCFGMDVHSTVTQQLAGVSQCLHCTHAPATEGDWQAFVELMLKHHGIAVPRGLVRFS